jgi:hypothetical protein
MPGLSGQSLALEALAQIDRFFPNQEAGSSPYGGIDT